MYLLEQNSILNGNLYTNYITLYNTHINHIPLENQHGLLIERFEFIVNMASIVDRGCINVHPGNKMTSCNMVAILQLIA